MRDTYAINLADLTALRQAPAGGLVTKILLAPYVGEERVTADPGGDRVDRVLLVLNGPAAADQERVEALVQLLAGPMGKRQIGRGVRVYRQPAGSRAWQKVKANGQ